jgi:hypothetical protein
MSRCLGWKRCAPLVGTVAALACGGDAREDTDPTMTTMTSITDSSSTSDTSGGDDDDDDDDGPPIIDVGVMDLGDQDCAGVMVTADQKLAGARVVFVVDNSPSMYYETAQVQERLNTFAEAISDEDIDVRVMMLSAAAQGYYTTNYVNEGICIAEPLGSGMCNTEPTPGEIALDTLEPEFVHIDQYVNSTNALPVIVEHHPSWGPFTQGVNTVHFVVVSDDDSNQSADYFIEHFLELEPHRAAVVHGVVPVESCEHAASIGDVYIELANLTGGVVGDLCDQDFVGVFQALGNAVVNASELPCEYEVPEPPEGEVFDPMKVNIEYDNGVGNLNDIGYVNSSFECDFVVDGWYYDDPVNPTTIIFCPQTCMDIQGHSGASISIVLGCATIPAG